MTIAWSHSVLDSFETCGWRHYLTKVTKEVVEGQSLEMKEGNRVHRAFEVRVKDKIPLPADLQKHEGMVLRLERSAVGGQIFAEQRLALDANFQPVSFFSKQVPVWVRSITDVTILKGRKAFIGDYKTGKPKPNSEQLKLSALVTFHHHAHIDTVINTFLWLKTDTTTVETFHRKDTAEMWRSFFPRVQRLEVAIKENKWPKKPSGLCREWCPVPHKRCEHRG